MGDLEELPTTDSGHVRKRYAMEWLDGLDEPSADDLVESVVPKSAQFTGSKYATEISDVRVTGTPEFVEAVARFLKPLRAFENDETRLEVKLQRTEDRETGALTDNYALYISVAERG